MDQILGEFIDAWNTGRRPDVDAYLERVPPREREQLATLLGAWLAIAPTPGYDAATMEAIRAEPALVAALEAAAAERETLAQRIARLRERAGLAIGDVAARLTARFGLDDQPRAASYLDRLEAGQLDTTRLSRRLVDALAAILGADLERLVPAPPAPAAQTFFRVDGEFEKAEIEALARAAQRPAPPPMDELDRLFLGGPEG